MILIDIVLFVRYKDVINEDLEYDMSHQDPNSWINLFLILLMPVLASRVLLHIQKSFFIPSNVSYGFVSSASKTIMSLSCVFVLIPFVVIINYIIPTKKNSDNKGAKGYKIVTNLSMSLLFVIMGYPFFVGGFYSYVYCKDDKIVVKKGYEINEKIHNYNDIDYIERKHYSNSIHYIVHFHDGYKFTIGEDNKEEIEKLFPKDIYKYKNSYVNKYEMN